MSTRNENWQGMNWIRQEKRLAIYLRDGCACVWCNRSIEDKGVQLSLDHVKVVNRGGSNDATNLVTCCIDCNTSRGAKSAAAFSKIAALRNKTPVDVIRQRIAERTRRDLKPHLTEAKSLMARRGSALNVIQEMAA